MNMRGSAPVLGVVVAAVVKLQRMDPELNCLSQVFAQYEIGFNQPYSTGFRNESLAAFHFRVVTYLGGLKNECSKRTVPCCDVPVCRYNTL